jgi:2-phosphoxylose phosphatase
MRYTSSCLSIIICLGAIFLYAFIVYGYSATVRIPSRSIIRSSSIDVRFYPPNATWITDLATVINGSGTYGMLFEDGASPNPGQYSYCNMRHVGSKDYVVPNTDEFELLYVEVVCRVQ